MKYEVGRNNLAITVFVPWDCQNNCKFCTSKKEYKNKCGTDTSNDKGLVNTILKYLSLGIKEIVFTGGEPLAQPNRLLEIIDDIFYFANFSNIKLKDVKIYMNTSLPKINYTGDDEKAVEKLLFSKDSVINGVNISRHCESYEKDVKFYSGDISDDSVIEKIKVPVRVNTVYNKLDLDTYLKRWRSLKNKKLELSIRADYRFIDDNSLKSFAEKGFVALSEFEGLNYINSGGCLVCNNDNFLYFSDSKDKKGLFVSYHRGLESSVKILGNTAFINDVIITVSGKVQFDWKPSELEKDSEAIEKSIAQYYTMLKKTVKKETVKKTKVEKQEKSTTTHTEAPNRKYINSLSDIFGNIDELISPEEEELLEEVVNSRMNSCGGARGCGH